MSIAPVFPVSHAALVKATLDISKALLIVVDVKLVHPSVLETNTV